MIIKSSFEKFWSKNILFPKTFVLDSPGIIVNKTSRWFGSKTTLKRGMYFFEDNFSQLQKDTIRKLGTKKSQELFYSAGKDLGYGYLLLANAKRVPKLFLSSVTKTVFKFVAANGTNVAKKIKFKDKNIIFEGSNNIFCRKTGDNSLFAGIFAGIYSYLSGENFDAKGDCVGCPQGCKIIISKELNRNYIPEVKSLELPKNYNKINIPKNTLNTTGLPSLNDFIRFKKIFFDSRGFWRYKDKIIVPSEQSMFSLIIQKYLDIGEKSLVEKSVIKSSEKLFNEIIEPQKSINEKIKEMVGIFSAFGWGIPRFSIIEGKYNFSFLHPPIPKYSCLYRALIINGFLNKLFENKFKIDEIKISYNPTVLNIYYKKV